MASVSRQSAGTRFPFRRYATFSLRLDALLQVHARQSDA